MQCPKCHASMHTYNRNGVQIEQCSGCRGIFLDYGELESLTRLESQWAQQAPPAAPGLPAAATGPGLGRPAAAARRRPLTAATAATTAITQRASATCSSPPDRSDGEAPGAGTAGGFASSLVCAILGLNQ